MKRILLVSDMHYTTDLTAEQMRAIDPSVCVSAAAGNAFGYTQQQKICRVTDDIIAEHKKSPLDMVLVLGDLSIDDYSFRNLPDNYCRKFKEECMDKLPCPVYAIPGNHDSYPNDLWKAAIGTDRQLVADAGECVFIMPDTFNSCPASGASGSAYTPVDTIWLSDVLEQHKGKKIFLCAHMFSPKDESDEFKRIVRENDDIAALFRGHTHLNEAIDLGDDWGGKLLLDIGGYGYCGFKTDGGYTFDLFCPAWAWGYQLLETDGDTAVTWHVKPAAQYHALDGVYNFEGSVTAKNIL